MNFEYFGGMAATLTGQHIPLGEDWAYTRREALGLCVGIGAWNAVAMLAVITTMPKGSAGRASGIVMLGFLGGLSAGSPVAGLIVDRWGTYQPVWFGALLLSIASAVVIRPGVLHRQPSTARH